jgi:hypothetical protein
MDEVSELKSLAAKCRRLASAIAEGPAKVSLLSLAGEYEQRAIERGTHSPEPEPLVRSLDSVQLPPKPVER